MRVSRDPVAPGRATPAAPPATDRRPSSACPACARSSAKRWCFADGIDQAWRRRSTTSGCRRRCSMRSEGSSRTGAVSSSSSARPAAGSRRRWRRLRLMWLPARSGRDDIVSLEDPIAYQIPGVTQTPVDDAGGEECASRLRSILQQQPDVVVVGALREAETATLALSAAARGLVITTVRADDLPSAVASPGGTRSSIRPRLPASLVGVVVQRLVRRLCASCRGVAAPPVGTAGAAGRGGVV